eukprot:353449-Chlamydomonas_euryale.AAC.11
MLAALYGVWCDADATAAPDLPLGTPGGGGGGGWKPGPLPGPAAQYCRGCSYSGVMRACGKRTWRNAC